MPEIKGEVNLTQDQVVPAFEPVMQMVDKYIKSGKWYDRAKEDAILRADYENNLSDFFATECTRHVESKPPEATSQVVDDFSKYFRCGEGHAFLHRLIRWGEDREDLEDLIDKFPKTTSDQKAALLAGYAATRLTQGYTDSGLQALERIAQVSDLEPSMLIGEEYLDFLTSAVQRLRVTMGNIAAAIDKSDRDKYPYLQSDAIEALQTTLSEKYGITWDANADYGNGAFRRPVRPSRDNSAVVSSEGQPVSLKDTYTAKERQLFRRLARNSKGARVEAKLWNVSIEEGKAVPVVAIVTDVRTVGSDHRVIVTTELETGQQSSYSTALSMLVKDLRSCHGHENRWNVADAAEKGDMVVILKAAGYEEKKTEFFTQLYLGEIASNYMFVSECFPVEAYRKISTGATSTWKHIAQQYVHAFGDPRNRKRPWPGLPAAKSRVERSTVRKH